MSNALGDEFVHTGDIATPNLSGLVLFVFGIFE
jgi:hypothetical protein